MNTAWPDKSRVKRKGNNMYVYIAYRDLKDHIALSSVSGGVPVNNDYRFTRANEGDSYLLIKDGAEYAVSKEAGDRFIEEVLGRCGGEHRGFFPEDVMPGVSEKAAVARSFRHMMQSVEAGSFSPQIVYLNGRKLGRHIGGFTAFNYDVTDIVKEGDNFVIVKVDNKRHRDNIPTDIFDWWNYGGITRDVFIAQVDDTYIQNYSLQLDRATRTQLQGWVQLNEKKAGVTITLRIPELKLSRTLTTDAEGRAQFSVKAKPVLWSPEKPKQYEVEWQMGGSTLKDQMGFRTIETKGKTILLNGKPVFLRGVSIHEEAPYRQGRAHTAEDAHTLLSWAKEMGCNYVRLAHYPHNELAVREAEKMGIMVWSEIPVYWTISWENPETYANAQRQLTDMISRDRNRAAIVIWSIANETPHSAPRDRFLGNLATYARSLDDTRLISMAMEVTSARNYVNRLQDNLNEFVDVISFNEYVGWYRDPKDAPKMTWEIPYDKPVIVSEFGGGALKGKYGDKYARFTEENQENIYRENLKMLEKIDGLAGLSPWILVDFRSPRRQLADVQDFFNRKGLVSSTGEKKKAFYVMQEFYRKKKESSF